MHIYLINRNTFTLQLIYALITQLLIQKVIMHETIIEEDENETSNNISLPVIKKSYLQSNITKLINNKIASNKLFYSIEISPINNFIIDLNELKKLPIFTAVTWFSNINLKYEQIENCPALEMACKIRKAFPVLTHVTCFEMNEEVLDGIFKSGVENIFALRGDFNSINQSFEHSIDLVRVLRKKFGDKLTIAVAGYPDVHPEAVSIEADLRFLKEKVFFQHF